MKRKTIGIGIGALLGVLMLVLGGIYYYVQTDAFMQKVEQTASSAASDSLGVPVEIGSVTVVSNHEIEYRTWLFTINRRNASRGRIKPAWTSVCFLRFRTLHMR